MGKKRIAIAGAGHMARVRGRAFLDTGRAEICAVASRSLASAQACATELGCQHYFDDYRRLAQTRPDALLIELPHLPQDEVALWALQEGYDLLIGGCLAANLATGQQIVDLATHQGLTVEAGYQRRYDPAWEEIHRLVHSGELGPPAMAVCMALWRPAPGSWYCDQALSGGMPLTHMSYCYLNAIRWILGTPVTVGAAANRTLGTDPSQVTEESCGALIHFANGAFLAATASYIGPEGLDDSNTRFLCAQGGVLVGADGALSVHRGDHPEHRTFVGDPMVRQANAFLDALEGNGPIRNPPADALVDLQLAAAITEAAAQQCTIALGKEL
ncbi:MAG: hypothetical protein GKR89_19605 [Candidatus Latescibacteria bacterium]|nr:hypothetical protein [Candidatus Latescibacterota bacterium]